jgi:hypothetical protein
MLMKFGWPRTDVAMPGGQHAFPPGRCLRAIRPISTPGTRLRMRRRTPSGTAEEKNSTTTKARSDCGPSPLHLGLATGGC